MTLQFGRYLVRRVLGSGALGVTYEGYDPHFREVPQVVKVFHLHLYPGPAERSRIQSALANTIEASDGLPKCLAKVESQELGDQGPLWATLEYLGGESLAQRLERGPLTLRQALLVTRQIAAALAPLHERGLCHGGLHERNIILPHGAQESLAQVELQDFGLSELYAMATPGHTPTAQQDVYALGLLLRRLQRRPGPDAARSRVDEVGLVDRLLLRLCAAAPQERPTLRQVAAELSGWLEGPGDFERGAPLPLGSTLPGAVVIPAQRLSDGVDGLLLELLPGSPLAHLFQRPPPSHRLLAAPQPVPRAAGEPLTLFCPHAGPDLQPLTLPLLEPDALACALAVAEALDELHQHDHFDLGLHPGRILRGRDGRWCLLPSPQAPGRAPVALLPDYQAPEQLEGSRCEAKTDTFGLGALLIALLTGAPTSDLAGLPVALRDLLEGCRRKDPTERPPVGSLLKPLRFQLLIAQLLHRYRQDGGELLGGKYHLIKRLGAPGGFAQVVLAQTAHSYKFAIKIPNLEQYQQELGKEGLAHFLQEISLLVRMNREQLPEEVVHIVDQVDAPGGLPCIVMELCRGQTLQDRRSLAGGWLDQLLVMQLGAKVAWAMKQVHEQVKLAHRDLKPQNIMIEENPLRLHILDFGIAQSIAKSGATQRVVLQDKLLATPLYMAPELANGRPASEASDVYALGVTLVVLLGRHVPDPDGLPPRPEAEVIDPALLDLLQRMQRPDPAERPGMATVHLELTQLAEAAVTPAREPPRPFRLRALVFPGLLLTLAGLLGYQALVGPQVVLRSQPAGAAVLVLSDKGEPQLLGSAPLALRPRWEAWRRGEALRLRVQLPGHQVRELALPDGVAPPLQVLTPEAARLDSAPARAIVSDLNNRPLGATPYRFTVSGPVLVAAPGYQPAQVSLSFQPGGAQQVTLAPLPRSLQVTAPAGAVIVNLDSGERFTGSWRCEVPERCLAPSLQVTAPSYQTRTFKVRPDQPFQEQIQLAPAAPLPGQRVLPAGCAASQVTMKCLKETEGMTRDARAELQSVLQEVRVTLCPRATLLVQMKEKDASFSSADRRPEVRDLIKALDGGQMNLKSKGLSLPTKLVFRCP